MKLVSNQDDALFYKRGVQLASLGVHSQQQRFKLSFSRDAHDIPAYCVHQIRLNGVVAKNRQGVVVFKAHDGVRL
jgi:hypothetical protein